MITEVDNPMSFVHSEHFMNYSSAVSCLAKVAMESQHACGQAKYTTLSRTEPLSEESSQVCRSAQQDSFSQVSVNDSTVEKISKPSVGIEQSNFICERKGSGEGIEDFNSSNSLQSKQQRNVLQPVQVKEDIYQLSTEEHNDITQFSYDPGLSEGYALKDNCSPRAPNFCALEPIFAVHSSAVQDTSMIPILLYTNQFPSSPNTTFPVHDQVSWTNWFHPSLLSSSTWKISNSKSRDHTIPWNEPESKVSCNDLYKTELCRSFMETGFCRYHSKCQFAHGVEELRPVKRHPKYKTRLCKNFVENGTCPYGSRCRFIHGSSGASSFEGLQTDLLLAVQGISLGKERRHSRLPVFQTLEEKSDIHSK
ncbi:zinc finger protein isoform 1 [Galdieria sulphuraria]|uniref:Zinc finger protein isoform 1 n=1 Tax=Galdieria sulphuraria TaxID=130081 RepID=M2Y4U6_GALSU|nr:zinc finger protein isoform 2 [Galdieria sulphuraria]XP_005707389.1 zinc finger protein isoform 1 [Galdieria sulphuraria]EME30868.1 zinc finger protein isoform 2 [Galdieria sulphuraria]EME30869.1 zinc finger protein isoform 1 [Galdieria sulphuraria]|eukprot:XP_005707388.1 zinc finger protein isoform 2 [Galdieria sulphuraria]